MAQASPPLTAVIEDTFSLLRQATEARRPQIRISEVGVITSVSQGVAQARGLPGVRAEELLLLPDGLLGLAFNLDEDQVGIILLGHGEGLRAGAEVRRTGRVLDVPVGEALLGRVLSPVGIELDGLGPVLGAARWPVERPAPSIMDRAPVSRPLQTGLKVVDALVPIGRGQRELILGDRQTGKTAIALDTVINQRGRDVICVYCLIGQRNAAAAKLLADLRENEAMSYTVVVVASGEDVPGLQFVAPYAATTIGEYFMAQGRDVLIVYDDLTAHARAYRELSLLLRRPPGREAFPGDIFYIHSRLLERSTHLREEIGGGSLTALPIIETEAESLSAYVPTNLISITDGQVYVSPDLFQKGVLPPVDVGESVSRVGGQAQLAAYRAVTGELRLTYSQFEELEAFSRFGTRLEQDTRATLERGRRIREVLKQPQYQPIPVAEQIAVLLAANEGVFDAIALSDVREAETAVRQEASQRLVDLFQRIDAGEPLSQSDRDDLLEVAREVVRRRFGTEDGSHD